MAKISGDNGRTCKVKPLRNFLGVTTDVQASNGHVRDFRRVSLKVLM